MSGGKSIKFAWLDALAEDTTKSQTMWSVGVACWRYADGTGGSIYPGVAALQRDTGLSRRAVLDALKALRTGEWLERVSQGNSRSGKADLYRLTTPALLGAGGAPNREVRVPLLGAGGAPNKAHEVQEVHPRGAGGAPQQTMNILSTTDHEEMGVPAGLQQTIEDRTGEEDEAPEGPPWVEGDLADAPDWARERPHRQKVKRISEVSGVEEIILFAGEDEGLSAQSDLPADVADWDDLLPTPSADASVPSAPPVAPLPTEPRQPSAAVSDDLGWGDLPSVLPADVEPPVASERHCSRCDSRDHYFYEVEACHLVPTADEEAVELDEAPEEPIGMVVGSRYGGGRHLVTLPPLADEPQRYRPRRGRSS